MKISRPRKTNPRRSDDGSATVMRRRIEDSSGFSLVELLVALVVFSIILTAIMALFISNTRLARTQLHLSDMQQSHRIAQHDLVRHVRIAGRGGLPTSQYPALPAYAGSLLPDGIALAVDNNVPAATRIAGDDDARVLEGTDILTVRGIFNSPVYQVNPAAGNFTYDAGAKRGSLVINKKSPTGVPQSLTAFEEAINDVSAEAILLISPLEDAVYAIVEMDPGQSSTVTVGDETESVTIGFVTDGGNTADYLALSPSGQYPPELNTVAYVGILEEYQFYIREARAIPGDSTSELMPKLTRARVFPGTDTAHLGVAANLVADQADNILDLQIALGVDTVPTDGLAIEGDGTDPTPTNSDEWLFNHAGDDPTEVKWTNALNAPARLFYIRINTLARTDRPDARFQAPLLTQIEDKDYSSAPFDQYNTTLERLYRRRVLQTIVDLRNL